MVTIVISRPTLALIIAHARGGMVRNEQDARPVDGGRVEIDIDLETFEQLQLVHPDPDQAIRVLCTTGVGNA